MTGKKSLIFSILQLCSVYLTSYLGCVARSSLILNWTQSCKCHQMRKLILYSSKYVFVDIVSRHINTCLTFKEVLTYH